MNVRRERTQPRHERSVVGAEGFEYRAETAAGAPARAELHRELAQRVPRALEVLDYHLKGNSLEAAMFALEAAGVAVRHVRHEVVGWDRNDEPVAAKSRLQ
jgi:hypothetical protein